jgi:predicted NAD/FAD-dependent oxidoreductase
MAGLAAAHELKRAGWSVVLLDKGRSPGGRMATRRIGSSRFDHGAQFFTVRDPQFRTAVEQWQQAGWVESWFEAEGHVRYRAAGGMSALAKNLAQSLDVRTETVVSAIRHEGEEWTVTDAAGHIYPSQTILLTAPAPQLVPLIAPVSLPAEMKSAVAAAVFDPCFALLVLLDGPGILPAPGWVRPSQLEPDHLIDWLADNTVKGISSGAAALTIHASPEFTRAHLDADRGETAALLLKAAQPWMSGRVVEQQLHLWRFAKPVGQGPGFLSAEVPGPLGIAGDAWGGGRVEGAFLSGLAAARWLRQMPESR